MLKHVITIRPSTGSSRGNDKPLQDVHVNGEKQGELYFNLRGYRGTLPMVDGSQMDIGEAGLSAWKREARILNREAVIQLQDATEGRRRVTKTRPTSDNRMVCAISSCAGEPDQAHLISRRQLIHGRKLVGRDDIGIGFFNESEFSGNPDADPVVKLQQGDEDLQALLAGRQVQVMHPVEFEDHERYVDQVYETSDPEVRVVVGTRCADDADPEPFYVSRASLDFGTRVFADALRIGDLEQVDAVRISDPATRSTLRSQFTWLDLDCDEDLAVRHDREQEELLREAEENEANRFGI